jgi:hypothetical protein
MALDILSKLDRNTAHAFEIIANYTIVIPGQPDFILSSIISDDMIKLEFLVHEMALRHLQSYGLVGASTGQSVNLDYFKILPPSTLGGQVILFSPREGFARGLIMPPMNGNAWPLSEPGMQLLPLLPKSFDRTFARRLRDGMGRLGVALTFPDIDLDADSPVK